MPYDNYDNLKTAVLKQTHRSNLDIKFDDFLAITEVEIRSNSDEPLKMNLNEQVVIIPTVADSRFLPLPAGFQSSRDFSVTIDDSVHHLTFRTPQQFNIRKRTGIPCFFTIRNNQIEFDITPEAIYQITITYTADLIPLSASNQTNDILTKYPNIYLYGCLKQASIYQQDTEQAVINDGLFSEAIKSANMSEHSIKYPTQPEEAVHWSP